MAQTLSHMTQVLLKLQLRGYVHFFHQQNQCVVY